MLDLKWLRLIAITAGLLAPAAALAQQSTGADDGPLLPIKTLWKMTVGGQLYDNWARVLSVTPPAETHPAYPAQGRQRGGETWRCKECHGWDYRGAEGAYGDRKNSHYTGIRGIDKAAGRPVRDISRLLRNAPHGYTRDMIPDADLEKLATFVSQGQINMADYIERGNGDSRGDPVRGKYFFEVVCSRCHGMDGRWINFRTASSPQYIGTLARVNPWEVIHKARYGQPGAGMVSYGEFFERYASDTLISPRDIADVVAYTQTLPED